MRLRNLFLPAAAVVALGVANMGAAHATDVFYPYWPGWSYDETNNGLQYTAGPLAVQGYLLAALPTCSSTVNLGGLAYITNGVASPTKGAAVGSTTGSTTDLVWCNGSWIYP
jgi:hypothetical protein